MPFRELGRCGPIPLGGAVVTGAGRLPHKAIIHVAGINMWWRSSQASIRASVRSAMERAREHQFASVAMPLIGAGTGGGRQELAYTWMRDELANVSFDGEVRIVRFPR